MTVSRGKEFKLIHHTITEMQTEMFCTHEKKHPWRLYSATTGKCESSNKNTTNLSVELPTGLLMSLKKESSLNLIHWVPFKTPMFAYAQRMKSGLPSMLPAQKPSMLFLIIAKPFFLSLPARTHAKSGDPFPVCEG